MFTAAFWKALAERALKTFAQSLAALLVVDVAGAPLDWEAMLLTAALATLASVLTSIASNAITDGDGPSLTDAEVLPRRALPDDGNLIVRNNPEL